MSTLGKRKYLVDDTDDSRDELSPIRKEKHKPERSPLRKVARISDFDINNVPSVSEEANSVINEFFRKKPKPKDDSDHKNNKESEEELEEDDETEEESDIENFTFALKKSYKSDTDLDEDYQEEFKNLSDEDDYYFGIEQEKPEINKEINDEDLPTQKQIEPKEKTNKTKTRNTRKKTGNTTKPRNKKKRSELDKKIAKMTTTIRTKKDDEEEDEDDKDILNMTLGEIAFMCAKSKNSKKIVEEITRRQSEDESRAVLVSKIENEKKLYVNSFLS